jgi:hypothetical protein
MNPGLFPLDGSMQQGRVLVQCKWVSGATGAVPALSTFKFSQGIKSVSRTSTGLFRITFKAPCAAYIGMTVNEVHQATYANTGACSVYMKSNQSSVVGSGYVDINITNAAGTLTDPTTNDVVCLEFALCWVNPR